MAHTPGDKNMFVSYGLAYRLLQDRLVRDDPMALDYLGVLKASDIVVVEGTYDHMHLSLGKLQIPFTQISRSEVAGYAFHKEQVVLVNCCCEFPVEGAKRLADFVSEGGMLVTTDWALRYVIMPGFPDTIQHTGTDSDDEVVPVEPVPGVEDDVIRAFVDEHQTGESVPEAMRPHWWLEVSSHIIKVVDPRVEVLLRSPELERKYGRDAVVCRIPWGQGEVYHMLSHAYMQRSRRDTGTAADCLEYARRKGASENTLEEIGRAHGVSLATIQSCLTCSEFLIRVVLKAKRRFFTLAREAVPHDLLLAAPEVKVADDTALSPAERMRLTQSRLLQAVAASLLHEPKYLGAGQADRHAQLIAGLAKECVYGPEADPEFPLRLACYVRHRLGLRATANYLVALAVALAPCHAALEKWFPAAVVLPSDMLDVVTMFQALPLTPCGAAVSRMSNMPAILRRCASAKFASYSNFQLAKYDRKPKDPKPAAAPADADAMAVEGAEGEVEAHPTAPKACSMKRLIRRCHLTEPRGAVMSLLGKKYPRNHEEFTQSGLEGTFDPARAGKRMRLPVPETWETQISADGNKAPVWERLLDHNKLPFMAMLRNIRNMLQAGVSPDHHERILARLTDEAQVAASKQFPSRFLSCYESIEIKPETLAEWAANAANPVEARKAAEAKAALASRRGRGRITRGRGRGAARAVVHRKPRFICPAVPPTPELLERYRQALDTAVQLATVHNVDPIPGRTVVFVDASGSMSVPCSSAHLRPSMRTSLDVALLLGLMASYASEECEMRLFGSPKMPGGRCDTVVPPALRENEGILANFAAVKEYATTNDAVDRGTDFPFQFFAEAIAARDHIDTIVFLSDMQIARAPQAKGDEDPQGRNLDPIRSMLYTYRKQVNPEMRFICIDLNGSGSKQARLERIGEADKNNVFLTGYSDALLKYIGSTKGDQLSEVLALDPAAYAPQPKRTPRAHPAASAPAPVPETTITTTTANDAPEIEMEPADEE